MCGEGGCKCKVEKRSFSSMLTVYSCKKTKLLNPPSPAHVFQSANVPHSGASILNAIKHVLLFIL